MILKLSKNATQREIRDAYLKLAKIYHPDKADTKSLKGWVITNEDFAQITKAYKTLIDPSKKAEYDREIRMGYIDESEISQQQHFTKIFKEGINAISNNRFEKAEKYFYACLHIKKDHPEANSFLALSIINNNGNPEVALEYAEKALKLKIDNTDLYVNIALVYKAMGNNEKYKKFIEEALKWNKLNKRALQEEMQIKKSERSIWGKIFKGGSK